MQRSALFRSRRELSNEYLLAKIGVDTAENEPLEVWGKIFNNIIIHWQADFPAILAALLLFVFSVLREEFASTKRAMNSLFVSDLFQK